MLLHNSCSCWEATVDCDFLHHTCVISSPIDSTITYHNPQLPPLMSLILPSQHRNLKPIPPLLSNNHIGRTQTKPSPIPALINLKLSSLLVLNSQAPASVDLPLLPPSSHVSQRQSMSLLRLVTRGSCVLLPVLPPQPCTFQHPIFKYSFRFVKQGRGGALRVVRILRHVFPNSESDVFIFE